ncbi:polysaccharide lyase family 7 protein [Cellulophaga baltica]|uniref:polysaccharide lyase family 7 protein n=1 Tax=Cellulophaga baltica TaxID=76594 RepID=UPI000403DDEE|nr:polysaccharide lyase family 7 protein [Cellulophaga baltica]
MKKMTNYKFLATGIFSVAVFLTSCSQTEHEEVVLAPEAMEAPKLSAKVYQISDFYIETSWLSGEESRSTKSFSSTGTDNESWYDKNSSGYYTMKSLATDGNRTEWKEIEESSLTNGKSMIYKAKVESIPENGVTIAQIHNRGNNVNRPWLRVFIDDDRKIKIKVTTNNPSNSSGTYQEYTGATYSQGSDYILSITYNGGGATVKVTTSSGSTIINKTISPSSSWNSYSNTYYFKAGVYTEGDDKQPKITFNYFYFND